MNQNLNKFRKIIFFLLSLILSNNKKNNWKSNNANRLCKVKLKNPLFSRISFYNLLVTVCISSNEIPWLCIIAGVCTYKCLFIMENSYKHESNGASKRLNFPSHSFSKLVRLFSVWCVYFWYNTISVLWKFFVKNETNSDEVLSYACNDYDPV